MHTLINNSNDSNSCIRFNPLLHNVEKWPNILLKSCGVHTARFLKYV